MKTKAKLTPADRNRCQAEKPNGNTFMTLGGVPGLVRCKNKPDFIARENHPGKDGQHGEMSLCFDCAAVMRKQMGNTFATLRPV